MDYWKKGLEFPFLAIFTRIMAELSLIWDYVCLIWFKVVLKNSDYQKYHKFPYEIKEIDLGLKTKMQEDFGGSPN